MVDNINFGSCNPDKYNDISLFSSSASGRLSPDDLHLYSSSMRDQHHDGLLPIANVGRIMKQILPPNAKISKEGKETMQECVSEFISFVTGEASDRCHKEKRKTVNGDDICWALNCLGFDNYADPLRGYLNRYRDIEGERAAHSGSSIANKASSSSYVPNNSSSYGVGGEGGETDHQSPSPTLLNFNVGNQIRRQSH